MELAIVEEQQPINPVEQAKSFLSKKQYAEARACMRTAINILSLLRYGLDTLIVCETLYYGDMNFPSCGIDWYSVLHLHPSATCTKIERQCGKINVYIVSMERLGFPGAADAHDLIKQAEYVLCNEAKRLEFDGRRKESGLVDLPPYSSEKASISTRSSFRYLEWKPPLFNSDVADYVQSRKRSRCLYEVHEEIKLSTQPSTKKTIFDAMPQSPHYDPLKKYTRKVREGMILGLDDAFVKLTEEIQQLKGPQSFWSKYDGFMEQLKQLEEMGYNVLKLRERLDSLKSIAGSVQASQDVIEKFGAEVSKIEMEIEQSKIMIGTRKYKISVLKKDVMEGIEEFEQLAKSTWK